MRWYAFGFVFRFNVQLFSDIDIIGRLCLLKGDVCSSLSMSEIFPYSTGNDRSLMSAMEFFFFFVIKFLYGYHRLHALSCDRVWSNRNAARFVDEKTEGERLMWVVYSTFLTSKIAFSFEQLPGKGSQY